MAKDEYLESLENYLKESGELVEKLRTKAMQAQESEKGLFFAQISELEDKRKLMQAMLDAEKKGKTSAWDSKMDMHQAVEEIRAAIDETAKILNR